MKHARFMIGLAAALALLMIVTTPAQAVDVSGWTRYYGPNYEFYFTENDLTNIEEFSLVINYGANDLILKVQAVQNNTVIYSQVVSPHSSQFSVLPFPDLTDYKVTISSNGNTLLTLPKTRSWDALPEPNDGNWHISPPANHGPLKYSEVAVQALLAALTLQNILIGAIIMGLGALIGALVKGITKFLTPTDFLSYTFYAVTVLDAVFNWFGNWNRLWYVPLWAGYFIGFILWYVPYLLPIRTDCKEKNLVIMPVAYYIPDDETGPCLQTQKNRALAKRLFLGIHHRLGTDAGLNQDWMAVMKKPYFPKLKGRALWIEKEMVTDEIKAWWRFKLHTYTTQLKLAYASKAMKAEFLLGAKNWVEIQDKHEQVWLEKTDIIQRRQTDAIEAAGLMVSHSVEVSPFQAIKIVTQSLIRPNYSLMETGEKTVTVIDAASTAPQSEDISEDNEEGEAKEEKEQTKTAKPNKKGKKKKEQEKDDDNDNE